MPAQDAPSRVKIFFELQQDEDGYPPVTRESLWATPTDDGLYRLDNIPFFAHGVAFADLVSAEAGSEGTLCFTRVTQPSGHATLRVIVFDSADALPLRGDLESLGCDTEQSHVPNLFAIDVPPQVSMEDVRRLLNVPGASERWEYEESCP